MFKQICFFCYNINMIVKESSFIISVAEKNKILNLPLKEFAFVGRSNCGKSSLINFLLGKKGLAKTSSTPGLTKLINYFSVNKNLENDCLFVDLPGYGYSKAGKKNHELWSNLMEDYLLGSPMLKRVFVLVDIRHEPNELDKLMTRFLYYHQIPFSVVATKADKISKAQIGKQKSLIAKTLNLADGNILVCSSEGKIGKEQILNLIENDLKNTQN